MHQDIASILERQAEDTPDSVFFTMRESLETYGTFNVKANRFADGLSDLGILPRENVAVMMPNVDAYMVARFGIHKLGAVEASINSAFRGVGLAHMLNLCDARVLLVSDRFIDRIVEIADSLIAIETLIVHGDSRQTRKRLKWEILNYDDVFSANINNPDRDIDEYDTGMIMFTSGTTGLSKGCVLSHRFLIHQAEIVCEHFRITADDTLYSAFPLFHGDATFYTVLPALLKGSRVAIGERFSASKHWDEIRHFGVTVFDFMGATLTILWKQPRQSDDADNPVRLAWGVPMPDFADAFEERFDLKLLEVYGLTDTGMNAVFPIDEPRRPGACGKPIKSYEVRIFDERDHEVPSGEVGEIVVRPNEPSLILDQYLKMPEKTLEAMRNLWFHTGDLGFMDEAGYLHFVERKTDSIRRRGQNISAFELEEAVNMHPAVLESAAIGVPSELTEEDVMIWVVRRPQLSVSESALVQHCANRVAKFMVPRYVQIVDELPKTPTEKIEKFRLKEIGLSPSTWDSERSSYYVG